MKRESIPPKARLEREWSQHYAPRSPRQVHTATQATDEAATAKTIHNGRRDQAAVGVLEYRRAQTVETRGYAWFCGCPIATRDALRRGDNIEMDAMKVHDRTNPV
jgi:hypothetical protein